MIEEDINERIARLAPSQNIAERQLKPAAIDAIAALPQAPTAQLAPMEQDQYGLNAAQDVLIKSLPAANDTAMKSSLMSARTVSPDQAARARKAATQAGVGTDIALRNLDEVERRAYMRDIDRMEIARRDPALAEFLRDRDNAMLAQDDIANLRETKSLYDTIIEYPRELMRDATIGVAAGMMDFRASMYAYDLRDRDAISETERSQMLGMFSLAETVYNTRQPGFVTSAARVAGQQVEPMQQAVGRGAETGLVFGGAAAVGGQIGPQVMLPEELVTVPGAMTFGFSAGMTSSLVETSFKQLAGYSYAEMMRENIPQRQAYWVSGVAGSINAGLELGGLALVTRPFRQVIAKAIARKVADELAQATTKQIATTAAKEYLIGGAGEVAVEVTQEVVDAVAVSAAQYIDQYGVPSSKRNVKLMTAQGWEELVDKSVKVGIETAKAMAILGVAGPFVKGTYTVVQMDKARKQAKFMEQAIELASLSKLRERDPVAYRNLLEQRAQATPAENVYIDANIMDGILRKQGITAADMDAVITDFSARLADAQASNSSIRLSSAEFIAQLSQSEIGRAMAQHLRVGDPNAMSMFDVAQGEAMRQTMLEQSRAAMEARTQADKAFVDSANRVEDLITEMLRETGKLTAEQVTATAEVMSAFVVVQAAEAKQTPEEFWARWRNQIVGPQAAPAMAGMEQAAQFDLTGQRRLDTPQFKQWFRESKAVDRKGMPLMLYHGTEAAEDFSVFEPGGGFFARGIYLSPRPKVAGEYAGTGTGARIMPLYASIQNPFVVDSDTTFEQAVSRETGVAVTEETSPDTITELLRSKGYDGVYVRADDVWVAFDPQQVKSVNNRGTWTGEAMLEQQPVSPTAELESVANVEAAFAFAGTQTFKTNRQFKEALQARVAEAAARNGIDLSAVTPEVDEYLVRVAVADAITALQTNPNAVGWYNEKVTKALRLVSLIHPEIATDPRAKFAFTWALAVTSNGLKVKKNFELAERVYSQYKATGRMPTNVQAGQAQKAINESLALFNDLVDKYGIDNVERFMTSKTTVKQAIEYTGKNVSGENPTTEVYGAAVLGPKIGNGFFANLYGHFEQLTMDRWLIRTWGRWTASLLDDNTKNIAIKRSQLTAIVKAMGAKARRDLSAIVGIDVGAADLDALAAAITKASTSGSIRFAMAKIGIADEKVQAKLSKILGEPKAGTVRVSFGDEFRKVGNALTKYIDGQKEAPSGPPERARIRGVMSRALSQLQAQYPSLTMSDLQALLWYPEKRLYDAAKTSDEGKTGYEDNEAPDYANAAADLAAEMGVAQDLIQATIKDVDEELKAIADERAATAQRGAGDGLLRQAPVAQAGVYEQAQVSPEFYSALERGIGEIDVKELTGAQWKERIVGLVNKGIVKQAEVEWSFLNEWLSLPREDKISKAQVKDYLKNNGIRVNVITYGGGDPTLAGVRLAEQALERVGALNDDAVSAIERIRTAKPEGQLYRQSWELLDELLGAAGIKQSLMDFVDESAPHFDEYVEADGRNYREELLQLPDTAAQTQRLELRNRLYREYGYLVRTRIEDYPQDNPLVQELKQIESTMTKRDLARFTMGHYDEPNVLVHIRRDDRTDAAGMLTMNVGELQSDWAQKGRELGFAKTEQEQDLAFWKGEVSRLTTLRDEFESGDDARRRIATAIDAVNELYADMQRTYSADKLEQMTDWREDEGQLKFEPDEGLTFEEIRDVLGGLMMDLSNAGYAEEADRMDDIADTMLEGSGFSELMTQLDAAIQSAQFIERTGSTVMPAPFVTSTSGWVDLALKHLMMEAVKGGYGRIIFPTWQLQMMRYGSDKFSWYRMPDGTYRVASELAWDQDAIADINLAEAGQRAMAAKGSRVSKAEDLKKIIEPRNPQMTAKQLDNLANKMWERMQASDGVGAMLPRREGMEAFYGDENMIDPKTGKLSIVGAALAKLSKKYNGPGISATEISIEEPSEGVSVVVTSPEQAERVMDWMEANVPDVDNVMDYDEERMAVEVDEMTERQRRRLEASFAGEADSPEITWVANPVGIDERHTRSGIEITPELAAAIGTGLPLFQDARGTFDPETFVTRLGQAGDISTVAHETAHYWLEVMGRIAGDSGAPARIVEDLDRVLQWFGIAGASPAERIAKWNGMSLEEKRKHHEAFALNFELYLFEGKAPSIELQGVFDKFKRWLMVVYKQIRDQLNVQYKQQFGRDLPVMTGEVRQVMDRLLATDEQIKRAQAMRDMMGDFETQEQSGLNDAEWEAYQSLRNEATDEAAREHAKASLRQMQWLSNAKSKMLKDMQARHKKMRDRMREEVSNAVRKERVYRAIDFLRRGRWINEEGNEETTTTHKLDAAAVQRMYEMEPENLRPDLAKLGKGKYGMLAKEGGMDPELAAEALGYASADEMIRAVIDARPIAEVIDERTDARMLAESGELATPQSREEAIDRALHNEARGRFIAVELRLHSKATQPANSMRQAARQVAKQVISGRRIRDIRPREYVAAESRAARDAANALRDLPDPKVAGQAAFTRSMSEQASAIAAGMPISDAQAIAEAARQDATRKAQERVDAYREKYPDADPAQVVIAAKRNQLLNNQMAAEAIAVRDEIETALEKFRRLFRPDEKIAKGRDMNLVNAGRAVLAYYGLGRSDKSPAEYLEQMRSYDPELYEELRPLIERAARGPQDYRDLTVDEFRIMRDAVEAFWYGSRRRNQIKVEGKLVDLETATSALVERLEEIGVPEVVPGERRAPTAKDRAVRALNTLKAIMTRVEHWTWRTDGPGDVRAFTTYIWRPVKDALIAYRLDRNTYVKRFVDLLGTITIPEGKIDAQELNYTFGYGNGGLGKAEVLGAMMHMGNESNLRKLLLGRGWGELDADGNLVTARWDAFVTRMFAEGVVTKADMDFLQAVWDLNEEIKPLAQKAHYELFGYYFQEVGASPIVTPFGEYRGGYVPAKTDSFMVADARSNEAMEELESDFRQSMPSTGRGFTRSRTEYNRPLSLDLRLMARHIDSVVRFAHVQPAIRDVLRILRVPAFRDALNRADPGAINDMLLPWLTRAARQVTMEPGMFKLTDKFWTAVRSRIGSSIMFANLRNALQQLTGAFPAMLRVEPGYFKSALATYIGSPFKVADEVASMSPFMANRMRSQMFELQESMNDILLNPSKYEKIQQWSNKHGYFLQTAHQNIVDIVTWTGAYNQSLAQSGLEASDPVAQREAIAAGDAAVRMTQGSMDPEDVSRVEVGSPFYRTFVQFTGYFNMLANLNSSEYIRVIRDLGWRSNKGRLVYIYVMGFMLPTIVADAIVRTLGGQWDDEDEDGYLDVMMSWFFGSQIRAGAAMIPFGSVGLQLATGGFTSAPYDDRISASPSLAALERATVGTTKAVIALIDPEKDVSGKNVRDVLTMLSLFTGIPAEVIGRPVGYALDVQRGEVEPTGMWDYIRGLITGAASPESKR